MYARSVDRRIGKFFNHGQTLYIKEKASLSISLLIHQKKSGMFIYESLLYSVITYTSYDQHLAGGYPIHHV